MSRLLRGMHSNDSLTENGAVTHSTTSSLLLDYFSTAGALRGHSENSIAILFSKAFGEDPLNALRAFFWTRDCRGGAGERRTFRVILKWLADNHTEAIIRNINLVSHFGRWDDLFELMGTSCEDAALLLYKTALEDGNALAAKWAPRPRSSKATNAYKLRSYMNLSEKWYRKMLSRLSKTVEQQMCANQWTEIKYEHVPSLAMTRYRKAFSRRDPEGFQKYMEAVAAGTKKIHAGVLYPHDIICQYLDSSGRDNVLEEQWKALPDFLKDNQENMLPVIDVSGSMYCGSFKPRPIDAAVSLALYLSERNTGIFKDHFIEFSSRAKLQKIAGQSLKDRMDNICSANWGMSTDVQGAFNLVLSTAQRYELPEREMPTMLVCISDMRWNPSGSITNLEMIQLKYKRLGYKMPKLIFWNLNAESQNHPAKFNDSGVCLISGYSPAIMKFVLTGETVTPHELMMQVLQSDRYMEIK